MNEIELAKLALDRNDRYINSADAKAGILTAFISILLVQLKDNFQTVISLIGVHQSNFSLVLAGISVAFIVIGSLTIYISTALVVYPRISPTKDSKLYFGTIAKLKSHYDVEKEFATEAETPLAVIASQVFNTSRIALMKFRLLKITFWGTVLAFVGWLLAIFLPCIT